VAIEWSDEFVERRMREHQLWRHEVEYALIEEVLEEVQKLPARKPKTARLFLDLPEFLADSKNRRHA
jgi:hypothetical protein